MDEPPRKSWLVRWVKRILKGVLYLFLFCLLLQVVYFVYEDCTGAYAWSKAKAELQAAGISLDPNTYISPPVPDDQNFAALPIFQMEPDPKYNGAPKLVALNQAIAPIRDKVFYPSIESYKPGMLPYLDRREGEAKINMTIVNKQLFEFCSNASPPINVPPNASVCDILSLICPVFNQLREANGTHPLCRFNTDYSVYSTTAMDLTTAQLGLAKALAYEEQLALLSGQTQLAMDDLKVDWKIVSGLQKEPVLISGLVTDGVIAIHLKIINDGLAQHAWNNQQLAELDADLEKMDFLAQNQLCLRGDFAVYQIPYIISLQTNPSEKMQFMHKVSEDDDQKIDQATYWNVWAKLWLTPRGYWDRYLAAYAPIILPGKMQFLDLPARRIFPEKEANFPSPLPGPDGSWINAVKQFALAQTGVNEARIACRLERYHLAHGTYPDSLAALTADYRELPYDIMNGESYHYKLNADGKYVIYSVGWDQKDDGGKGGGPNGNGRYPDSPDWIWTN